MTELAPLPRDDDGYIQTSAEYGATYIVLIDWTEDENGRPIVPGTEEYPRTHHGPFASYEEAQEWVDAYPEFTEIDDIRISQLNSVRPA